MQIITDFYPYCSIRQELANGIPFCISIPVNREQELITATSIIISFTATLSILEKSA
jgi:hypothetical protein